MRTIYSVNVILIYIFSIYSSVYCVELTTNCGRNCGTGSLPKKCLYNFYVTDNTDKKGMCNGEDDHCDYKLNPGFLINGKSPGPSIEVCLGDTIVVIIHNKFKSEELSFHWNGIHQKSSAHMDGVPMVTQCPILPFTSFRYYLKPSKSGTFFYHAHSVLQQENGLFGSLIVRGLTEDLNLENIFLVSARPSRLFTLMNAKSPEPVELLVNGKGNDNFEVEQNRKYHFRVINANALNCPISFTVADHDLNIISADGTPVGNTVGRRVILFPGERADVEVQTSRPAGRYAMILEGHHDCRNLITESILAYKERDGEFYSEVIRSRGGSLKLPEILQGQDCETLGEGTLCLMDLKGERVEKNAEQTFFVAFDEVFYDIDDHETDYKFNIYGYPYYPAYLSVTPGGTSIPQICGMTFKYPPSPILSQPEGVSEEILCDLEYKSRECSARPLFCECLQIFEVPAMKNIDIILIDEGKGGNNSFVFHLHGYSAAILSSKKFDHPISKSEIMALEAAGKISRNFQAPVQKDTFVVPNKGYIILRLFTDNLGYWLWESRQTGLSPGTRGPGMQFLMRVGTTQSLPTVPLDFPTCSNHKGPDLIFEGEY